MGSRYGHKSSSFPTTQAAARPTFGIASPGPVVQIGAATGLSAVTESTAPGVTEADAGGDGRDHITGAARLTRPDDRPMHPPLFMCSYIIAFVNGFRKASGRILPWGAQ
jgi:hypothetical protein